MKWAEDITKYKKNKREIFILKKLYLRGYFQGCKNVEV